MGRKSVVENSLHYTEILDMIKEGLSSTTISDYLEDEYDELIPDRTIRRYIEKIKSKTSSEYYKKKKKKNSELPKNVQEKKAKEEKLDEVIDKGVANKESFDDVVTKGVSDLDALDNIIKEAEELNMNIGNLKAKRYSDYVITTEADIEKLKIQAKNLAIRAVTAKAKILKDDPGTNINVNIGDKTDELNELFDDL